MHPDAHFVKTFEDGSSIELQPLQFHMHQPSEHTIDGRQYDLEVHIVHTNADGQFGVLGFMFDSELGGDGENLFLGQIPLPNPDFTQSYGKDGFGNVIHTKNAKISLKGFMDSVDKTEFWSYNGSLTTPPCTEGIKWTVFSDIQPISKTQVEAFKALWG